MFHEVWARGTWPLPAEAEEGAREEKAAAEETEAVVAAA
jgi:hypothetical protein